MIIKFCVKNFRSFKDEQVFSLDTSSTANSTPVPQTKKRILNSVGVYGANASGKSNLLKAIYALYFLVSRSGKWDKEDKIQCFEPYLLSPSSKEQPVETSIEFITAEKKNRFQYFVSFTRDQILKEQLKHYTSNKWTPLFSRTPSHTRKAIKDITLRNQCYLSVAGRRKETSDIVMDAYTFFRKDIVHFSKDEEIDLDITYLQSAIPKVSSFVQCVDTGVERISLKKRPTLKSIIFPQEMPDHIKKRILNEAQYHPVFYHQGESETLIPFNLRNESEGTQRLYNRLPLIIDALETGGVLVIDELDNSLHPFICELIVRLFNDPEVNKCGAQLIFSTHDVSLLSRKVLNPERMLLNPEQIWFTEKKDGMTTLFSLADFDKKEVKEDSPFGQWYEEGRFGAYPKYNWYKVKQLFPGDGKNEK